MKKMCLSWEDAPIILTAQQVSELLGVSPKTIRIRCAKKEIPAIKIGKLWRIDKQKLMEVTKRNKSIS